MVAKSDSVTLPSNPTFAVADEPVARISSAPGQEPLETGPDGDATAAAASPRENTNRRFTLPVLLAGTFVAFLDIYIVNVALPTTQKAMHTSTSTIQWVVAGYGIALAVGLVTGGRLGDLMGRRTMFIVGLALFTIASTACGLAPDATALIAARVAQGLAAALLLPQVLGMINVIFSGAGRLRAYTAYGVTIGLSAVFGQLIGGALIQADIDGYGWRTIYWINVPIGLLAIALAPWALPALERRPRTRLDLVGAALLGGGLLTLILPLVEGRQDGWPAWTWYCLAAAPVVGLVFLAYQRRLKRSGGNPLVDLNLFTDRAFSVGLALAMTYYLAITSFFFVLSLYLQLGRGLSPLHAGLLFGSLGIGYIATSLRSGKLAARFGRQVLAVGACIQALGYGLLALSVHHFGAGHPVAWLAPALALIGCGIGLALAPMSSTVLADVAPGHAAAAAGLLATMQQVGGALGVAVVGIVYFAALGQPAHAGSFGRAFTLALFVTAAFCLLTACLVQLLPDHRLKRSVSKAAGNPRGSGEDLGREGDAIGGAEDVGNGPAALKAPGVSLERDLAELDVFRASLREQFARQAIRAQQLLDRVEGLDGVDIVRSRLAAVVATADERADAAQRQAEVAELALRESEEARSAAQTSAADALALVRTLEEALETERSERDLLLEREQSAAAERLAQLTAASQAQLSAAQQQACSSAESAVSQIAQIKAQARNEADAARAEADRRELAAEQQAAAAAQTAQARIGAAENQVVAVQQIADAQIGAAVQRAKADVQAAAASVEQMRLRADAAVVAATAAAATAEHNAVAVRARAESDRQSFEDRLALADLGRRSLEERLDEFQRDLDATRAELDVEREKRRQAELDAAELRGKLVSAAVHP